MDIKINIKDELNWDNEAYALLLVSLNDSLTPRIEKLKKLKQDNITTRLINNLEKILLYRNTACDEVLALLNKYRPLKQFFDYLVIALDYDDNDNNKTYDNNSNDNNNEVVSGFLFGLFNMCFVNDYEDKESVDDKVSEYLKESCEEISNENLSMYNFSSLDSIIKFLNDVSVPNEEKLLFINFYIDKTNMYSMIQQLKKEVIEVCRKNYYIIENEHTEYIKSLKADSDIIQKINEYIKFEINLDEDVEIYVSAGFYNSLTLRNINNKYIYLIGLCMLDFLEVKAVNKNEAIISDLKVLSDSTRLKIIKAIMEEEKYLQEIATELELTPATISHHINLLLNSGYLSIKVNTDIGKRIYYGVNKTKIEDIIEILRELIS